MDKNEEKLLRNELVRLLNGSGAHAHFEPAIDKVPKKFYGASVKELPYTLWQLLEHMRLAQFDILDYIKNPDYRERQWPQDYWPKEKSPATTSEWNKSIEHIQRDLQEIKELVENPKTQILEPIPHLKNGPSILREILLVADHNAYHIGQIVLLRRLLGIWKD